MAICLKTLLQITYLGMAKVPYALVVFSDLHVGNMFDFKAFYDAVALNKKILADAYVSEFSIAFLGDVCDASEIYRTQLTLAENRLQRYIATEVISEAIDELKTVASLKDVIVTAGNHDLRKGLELVYDVVRLLREKGYQVFYTENYLVYEIGGIRFLLTHTMSRRSRGSYFGGLTGYILTKILYLMVKTKSDIAVIGHTHKGGVWQDLVYQCSSFHIENLDINDRTMWTFIINDGKVFPERIYVTPRLYSTQYQMEIMKFYIEKLIKLKKIEQTQPEIQSIIGK